MKRHKTLISGGTDFAHLNDYIFLANFKLENLLYTRGFNRSFISKITECCFYSFHKLGLKITISQFGTTVA